ncbi:C4-dicarboxylate ABC transporter substrate-binding protein [Brevibacterium samyangense]|uniref:TRAP-type C4-dicarboxylate transport system, substrate-binding protein n=1 Tax=Brevibacterium samyangense TaxID=366888 RepID=A0ABP5ESL6_9MICO
MRTTRIRRGTTRPGSIAASPHGGASHSRGALALGALLASAALTACAGGVGDAADDGASGGGYAWGADQAAIDEAIADLEPVELVFQASATSPNSAIAESNIAYAEAIEEKSGGKISVEILYGHPIAGYAEIYDALADGRVDVSYTNPAYNPDLFPAFDDLVSLTSNLPESPMAGELVAVATLTEMAWNNENIRADFEAEGLYPLVPVNPPGAYFSLCNTPGSTLADWQGRQVRVGSATHDKLVSAMGGTPVSLEYVETYEALQRATIDCTMIVMSAALEQGYMEVAPNLTYTGAGAIPRVFGSMLAGQKVANLPLAYQQIVFDSWYDSHLLSLETIPTDNMRAVEEATAKGGKVEKLAPDAVAKVEENRQASLDEVQSGGLLGDDVQGTMDSTIEKWQSTVAELGYEDGGELTDMDAWFDPETFDSTPYVDRLYDDVISAHRPS